MPSESRPDRAVCQFELRYERIAPALCLWTMRHVGRSLLARVEVEDVMQEIWLRAIALRPDFDGDESGFRRWIFGVAKKLLLEVQRSVRRAQRVLIGEGRTTHVHALENATARVTALTQRVMRDDGLRRFHTYLEALEREDQELVAYCGLEGSSAVDAARKLGISTDAAQKRWQRLRSRLRSDGQFHDWLG